MIRFGTFVLACALLPAAARGEAPIPQAYGTLQGLFKSMQGHRVQVTGGRDALEMTVDTVGADLFCGRSTRGSFCLPYASVLFVELVKPDFDRVHVRADASPAH